MQDQERGWGVSALDLKEEAEGGGARFFEAFFKY